MKLNFEVVNNNLVVRFTGELDHHTAADIRKKIDKFYTDKMLKNVIVDLKNLNFMDSSGIGLIMGRYKITYQNGGKLCLINVSPRVEKILKMSGVLKIVRIYNDINEVLDNI